MQVSLAGGTRRATRSTSFSRRLFTIVRFSTYGNSKTSPSSSGIGASSSGINHPEPQPAEADASIDGLAQYITATGRIKDGYYTELGITDELFTKLDALIEERQLDPKSLSAALVSTGFNGSHFRGAFPQTAALNCPDPFPTEPRRWLAEWCPTPSLLREVTSENAHAGVYLFTVDNQQYVGVSVARDGLAHRCLTQHMNAEYRARADQEKYLRYQAVKQDSILKRATEHLRLLKAGNTKHRRYFVAKMAAERASGRVVTVASVPSAASLAAAEVILLENVVVLLSGAYRSNAVEAAMRKFFPGYSAADYRGLNDGLPMVTRELYGVDTLTRWLLECPEAVIDAMKKTIRANAEAVAHNRKEETKGNTANKQVRLLGTQVALSKQMLLKTLGNDVARYNALKKALMRIEKLLGSLCLWRSRPRLRWLVSDWQRQPARPAKSRSRTFQLAKDTGNGARKRRYAWIKTQEDVASVSVRRVASFPRDIVSVAKVLILEAIVMLVGRFYKSAKCDENCAPLFKGYAKLPYKGLNDGLSLMRYGSAEQLSEWGRVDGPATQRQSREKTGLDSLSLWFFNQPEEERKLAIQALCPLPLASKKKLVAKIGLERFEALTSCNLRIKVAPLGPDGEVVAHSNAHLPADLAEATARRVALHVSGGDGAERWELYLEAAAAAEKVQQWAAIARRVVAEKKARAERKLRGPSPSPPAGSDCDNDGSSQRLGTKRLAASAAGPSTKRRAT
ncbi:hypothetical protein HDU90_008429 [Geranomyces variabilis]|nr:hypothetical protein HDU90_008429 [Geranomyces variabilis]